jgi:hypothetical protein
VLRVLFARVECLVVNHRLQTMIGNYACPETVSSKFLYPPGGDRDILPIGSEIEWYYLNHHTICRLSGAGRVSGGWPKRDGIRSSKNSND